MNNYKLQAPYEPNGDQPEAIASGQVTWLNPEALMIGMLRDSFLNS